MDKCVIGLGQVETAKNCYCWSIVIKNYILTEKYDISLQVKGKRKIVRVNERTVYDGDAQPTFQINEFHQGTINGLNLLVDSVPFEKLIDNSYVYQPPKVEQPKIKVVKETVSDSVFEQMKKIKKQELEILIKQKVKERMDQARNK